MKTIEIPASYLTTEDIVKPVVTTAVPDDASGTNISVVATLDLSKEYPVHTITRISPQDITFYDGEIAPFAITVTLRASGDIIRTFQKIGHRYGEFSSEDSSVILTYSPVTKKVTYASGTVSIESDESYPSVSDITTLTFKTSIGGVSATYATATASESVKCTIREAGTVRAAPAPAHADLVAASTATGIKSVQTQIVIPAGSRITHNATGDAKIYLTF